MAEVGEQLAGYRIEAVAGTGERATVYSATSLSSERRVALKVLPATSALGSADDRERIRRIAREASDLRHDHIVPVLDSGDAGAWMYVAMLFVDGASLRELIDSGALTIRESLRVLAPIAEALDVAHEAGLVHGDVKPSNILLTAEGHPYLTDFGMAGDACAAPEQLEGRRPTAASDVYALTAVLDECLGGASPEVDEIVARGMAAQPSHRYRSAGELVAACEAALAQVPDHTRDRIARGRRQALSSAPPAPAPAQPASPARSPAAPAPPAPAPAEPAPAEPAPAQPAPAEPATGSARRRSKPFVPPLPTPEEEAAALQAARARPLGWPLGRPLAIAAAVAALLAPLLLGYALGGEDAGPAAPRATHAASDSVELTVPAGWRTAGVEIAGLALAGPIGLRHDGGVELAAGRLRDPAAGLDPTRAPLRARIREPRKDVVQIAGRRALRYAGELPAGGTLWLVLLPDSKGWTAVACRGPSGARLDELCGRLARSLEPVDATRAQLGPDDALGATLRDELATLAKARRAAHDRLRARSARTRGRAAATLAGATASAAGELADVEVRTQDQPLVGELVAALEDEAKALDRLAGAAERNDRSAYRRRRNAVRSADKLVVQALRALRRGGYGVTVRAA